MHADQRAGNVRGRPDGRPVWLVVAAVGLAAATAYLCFSLVDALNGSSRSPFESAVSDSIKVIPIPADSYAEPPKAEAAENSEAPGIPAPTPLPGLPTAVGDPELLAAIEEAAGDDTDHVAVSARRISDGRSAALNGAYQFYAASTFKLAVLYEAELRHFREELAYDDTIFMSEDDAAEDLGTSGALEFEPDGSITIGHLLEAMITVSDNSSAVALMHEFGSGNIDGTLRDLGITTMTVNTVELWTTADDLARLMEAIYVGEGVGPEEREHMRGLLLGQSIRRGIPAAIDDDGVLIGNKTGTWIGAEHDVAFVDAQSGAYVIAILTDGSFEGWQALHRIARGVHEKFVETR